MSWSQAVSSGISEALKNPKDLSLHWLQPELLEQIEIHRKESQKKVEDTSINVIQNGSITYGEESLHIIDIQNAVNSTLKNSGMLTEGVSFEIAISNYFKRAATQHPVIYWFLCFIVVQFALSVTSDITSNFLIKNIDTWMNQNKKVIVKSIKKETKSVLIEKDLIKDYRFVSTANLVVRHKGSIKSKKIGNLYLGQVVKVIHKKKDWSLVEYTDNNGEIYIKGWVFTRYIKSFN